MDRTGSLLVRHTAAVHRWAATTIRERHERLRDVPYLETLFGSWPVDSELVRFYRLQATDRLRAIQNAPDDLKTAAFLEIDPQKVFWSRRQFQEATIHRADLQVSAGVPFQIGASEAADGVDEMLRGFVSRSWIKLRTDQPKSIHLVAEDAGQSWVLRLSAEAPLATREAFETADCVVNGDAQDMYLALWNRPGRERLTITGESTLMDLFQQRIQIKW